MNGLPFSPAADRNKQPILEALCQLLPARGLALEIASGTGQHTACFAAGLPCWSWQPTDLDPSALSTIAARVAMEGLRNVATARLLDVRGPEWPTAGKPFSERFDAIFCANMLHITPWEACAALMQGAARYLSPQGLLITYGPYLEAGLRTATGNQQFDTSLRAANPSWGLRALQDVSHEAQQAGLLLQQRLVMPANNLLLVWGRGTAAEPT